jgi:mevalonate kinase
MAPKWSPKLYLSYSGKRGVTSECVKRVSELRTQNPQVADKIDAQMRESVELAEAALHDTTPQGFDRLAHALDLARDCFYQWGLCEGALDQHLKVLSRAGAYALKPTGSGGGGYVLSLWREEPPMEIMPLLIPLFSSKPV